MAIKNPAFAQFKASRWYGRAIWGGCVFLAYLLVGFLVLPPIIKSQIVKHLPVATQRQVAIRQVKCNPLALSLTVRGLSLAEADGSVFASFEEMYVNFQLSSIARFAWTFAEIGLKQPYSHVQITQDGRPNFANMFAKTPRRAPVPEAEKAKRLPRVNVWHLHVDDGAVVLDDQTHRVPLHSEFRPINLALTNLTTRVGRDSLYSFTASSDSGKSFSWIGFLMVQPFESRGHFEVVRGELGKLTPLLRDHLRAEITNGYYNLRADYSIASGTNGFDAGITNGAFELSGLKIKDLNTSETVASLPSLSIGPVDFNLRQRTLHAGLVRMAGLTKTVRIEKDGQINLHMLLEPPVRQTEPESTNKPAVVTAAPWIISVDEFTLDEAAIAFADLSRPSRFETILKPFRVQVKQFTTRPNSDAAYEFMITSEAAETVSGAGTFSIAPLHSSGGIKLASLELRKYAPFFQEFLRGEILAGRASAETQYNYIGASNGSRVTISNAGVALAGFRLRAADADETVVAIPSLSVERTEASSADRTVRIGMVRSSGGSMLARQHKDGSLNLMSLVNRPVEQGTRTNTVPSELAVATHAVQLPWSALIEEISLDNYTIRVEDEKLAKPASLGIDQLALNVKGLSTASNTPVAAMLAARFNEAGTVAVQGVARIRPVMADLDVSVTNLDLRPFQPYFNEYVRLTLGSGRVNSKGRVRYAPSGTGSPLLKYTGEISLANFATGDQVLSKEFISWDALDLDGITLDLQPNQLQLQEVRWRGLKTSVIIGPDHRLNLAAVLPEKDSGSTMAVDSKSPFTEPSRGFPIQLSSLVFEDAAFHFADESIEPHGVFDIKEFRGTIKGLSSELGTTANLDVNGNVDAHAPFSISGKINPLAKDLCLDLAMTLTNTDLTAFTPYMETYAGYPLAKGKLSMALRYAIDQKQLKAENKFLIDQFTLGPRNDNTNATALPVKLAVALLKDRNGRIDLDVPLSGRIDDPQFRIAPLIGKVILNLIVKAAASPFALLGAAFGGGEELSFVDFSPGRADILESEAPKLDKLVRALYDRPALSLEISGSFHPEKDGIVVAKSKLEQRLKTLRIKELAGAGKPAQGIDTIQLDTTERERLLRQVYRELGTNQTLIIETTPSSADTNAATTALASPVASQTVIESKPDAGVGSRPSKPAARKSWLFRTGRGLAHLVAPKKEASAVVGDESRKSTMPSVGEDSTLALEQIEEKLVSRIQISEEDQRDLITRRAQAVQSHLLKSEKVTPDRLFIVAPKRDNNASRGECRVNLALN